MIAQSVQSNLPFFPTRLIAVYLPLAVRSIILAEIIADGNSLDPEWFEETLKKYNMQYFTDKQHRYLDEIVVWYLDKPGGFKLIDRTANSVQKNIRGFETEYPMVAKDLIAIGAKHYKGIYGAVSFWFEPREELGFGSRLRRFLRLP